MVLRHSVGEATPGDNGTVWPHHTILLSSCLGPVTNSSSSSSSHILHDGLLHILPNSRNLNRLPIASSDY